MFHLIQAVLVAVLVQGGERIQVLSVSTGPEDEQIKAFTKLVEDAVAEVNKGVAAQLQPRFTLEAGIRWDSAGKKAAYYVKLHDLVAKLSYAKEIPIQGEASESAACELMYNVKLAITAAQQCKGLNDLCPAARKHVTPCKERR